jgi:hypothetical protein
MSKRKVKAKLDSRLAEPEQLDVRIVATVAPKPRAFTPRDCSLCTARRPKDRSYSKVYKTRGTVRYVKCEYCGNTWSQYFGDCTSTLVHGHDETMPVVVSLGHGISGEPLSTDRCSD